MRKRYVAGIIAVMAVACLTMVFVGVTCGHRHATAYYLGDATTHTPVCACGKVLGEPTAHQFNTLAADSGRVEVCGVCATHQGEFNAFKVDFITPDGVTVLTYPTQEPPADGGYRTTTAYARDSLTGDLLNDGTGQVNFTVVCPVGQVVDMVTVTPTNAYKNLQDGVLPDAPYSYRLTKIITDCTITITTVHTTVLRDLTAVTDADGQVAFTWASDYAVDAVAIEILKWGMINGSVTPVCENYTVTEPHWSYQMEPNRAYDFTFVAYVAMVPVTDGEVVYHGYYQTDLAALAIPRVEIVTENYLLPACDFAYGGGPTNDYTLTTANNVYRQCTVAIFDDSNTLAYDSSTADPLNPYAAAKIRVRGNTSAEDPKKSFKLKLATATDLLAGLVPERNTVDADRDWVLLACGSNPWESLVGWSVAETLQMAYVPAYAYCVLTVNGDYRGLYLLCESVKRGNNDGENTSRVNVSATGYLAELDLFYWHEDFFFTTPWTAAVYLGYTFKYPDPDALRATATVNYLKNYLIATEQAVLKGDGSYRDYIDVTSFATWLLVHDLIGTLDTLGSNIFLTKDDNTAASKLQLGPIWDLENICQRHQYSAIRDSYAFFFPTLLQDAEFVATYRTLLNNVKDQVLPDVLAKLNTFDATVYDQVMARENRCWPTYFPRTTLAEAQTTLTAWFNEQIAWLLSQV